jgi:hypothetical protein
LRFGAKSNLHQKQAHGRMNRMSINFFLNWEEYFAAQEFFRRSRSRLAPEHIAGGVMIALGAALFFAGDHNIAGIVTVILGAVVIVAGPLLRRSASRHKWNREPLYHTEHTVAANDDGVYFQMGKVESNLVWRYYQCFLESQDGFLLIYGGDSFNYLPKRAFAGPETIDQFRSLASSKLSGRLSGQARY